MKFNWKSIIGGIAVLMVLFWLPSLWQWFFVGPGGLNRGHMSMMGYSFLPFGGWSMWLLPVGALLLIGVAVAWLTRDEELEQVEVEEEAAY